MQSKALNSLLIDVKFGILAIFIYILTFHFRGYFFLFCEFFAIIRYGQQSMNPGTFASRPMALTLWLQPWTFQAFRATYADTMCWRHTPKSFIYIENISKPIKKVRAPIFSTMCISKLVFMLAVSFLLCEIESVLQTIALIKSVCTFLTAFFLNPMWEHNL